MLICYFNIFFCLMLLFYLLVNFGLWFLWNVVMFFIMLLVVIRRLNFCFLSERLDFRLTFCFLLMICLVILRVVGGLCMKLEMYDLIVLLSLFFGIVLLSKLVVLVLEVLRWVLWNIIFLVSGFLIVWMRCWVLLLFGMRFKLIFGDVNDELFDVMWKLYVRESLRLVLK